MRKWDIPEVALLEMVQSIEGVDCRLTVYVETNVVVGVRAKAL
ncbi:MAG: hypothetical protein JW384_02839 [Nitrosomonadaceae bacterium]|nr:hypothetical protein [Nitrosomonadaceae bacterium]